jgi:hypothetical protein
LTLMKRLWLTISLSLAATQCGGLARPNRGDLCLPGKGIECDCIGHTKGVRMCTAEGIGYGECVCGGEKGDGGTIDDDGGPPVESCTSKSAWTGGLRGSDEMTPGRACMACHVMTPSAPQYTVSGTVYAGPHDADDCNGVDGLGVAVAILSDTGDEIGSRLQLNRVGNFFATRAMPPLYRVKVLAGGRERVKQSPVRTGDCNLCHTAAGTMGASGRLLKP